MGAVAYLLKVHSHFPRVKLTHYFGKEVLIYGCNVESFLESEFVVPVHAHP